MKSFKKLFLTAVFLTLSSIGFMLAMDQNPSKTTKTYKKNDGSDKKKGKRSCTETFLGTIKKFKSGESKTSFKNPQDNQNQCELAAKLPTEIIKLIALSLEHNDQTNFASCAQFFKNIIDPIKPIYNSIDPILLKTRFIKITQKKQLFINANTNTNISGLLYLQAIAEKSNYLWNLWLSKQEIDLSHYKFTSANELEKALLSFKCIWNQIKTLNLKNCNISELPAIITSKNFPNLKILNLSSNNPTQKTLEQISQIFSLEELSLNNCEITKMPKAFCSNFIMLKKLSLNFNRLDKPSLNMLAQLTYLTELNLENCDIEQLPDNFTQLIYLQKLNLGHNNLFYLSRIKSREQLAQLPLLQELNLSGCFCLIAQPNNPFKTPGNLKTLILNEAHLTEDLCWTIVQFSSIEELILLVSNWNTNSLKWVVQRLPKLKKLKLYKKENLTADEKLCIQKKLFSNISITFTEWI